MILASINAAGSLPSAVRYSDHQSPKMGGDGRVLQSNSCSLAVLIHSVKMLNLGSFNQFPVAKQRGITYMNMAMNYSIL